MTNLVSHDIAKVPKLVKPQKSKLSDIKKKLLEVKDYFNNHPTIFTYKTTGNLQKDIQ
jgi:hypothetical protein